MSGQRNPNEIGSAWMKVSKNGSDYVSIALNENASNFDLANCFIDMYVNEHKSKPTHPDYRIIAKPKQQQAQKQQPQQRQGAGFPRPRNFAPRGGNEGGSSSGGGFEYG